MLAHAFALTFSIVSCLAVLSPVEVQAENYVHFTSDPGDYAGGGQERTFGTSEHFDIIAHHSPYGEISIAINNYAYTSSGYENWDLDFSAPNHQEIAVGDYQNVGTFGVDDTRPGMVIEGNGRLSSNVTGSFQVLDVQYDYDGSLLRFSVNFEQHLNGLASGMRGEIRYVNPTPPPRPQITVDALTPTVSAHTTGFGAFTLHRTGAVTNPLTVQYKVSGTAVGGQDYRALIGTKTFKVGFASARIKIKPFDTGRNSGSVVVKVKIAPPSDSLYETGSPRAAKMTIVSTP